MGQRVDGLSGTNGVLGNKNLQLIGYHQTRVVHLMLIPSLLMIQVLIHKLETNICLFNTAIIKTLTNLN